ncbi:hypothetical protein VNO80_05130 [Phaseolus coccineus]|uniref:Uncharacterized protein n=1 Tax=Phaseolus coccineus TaxID=3886 RepID=A0AAN9NUY9_PHACN
MSLSSPCRASSTATNLFVSPWSSSQRRGIKVSGSDIRVGNIIGKQGSSAIGLLNFTEVSIRHVELRDIGQGNKVTQRMGTDDDIEKQHLQAFGRATPYPFLEDNVEHLGDDIDRVYVQVKTFMFMCMDRDGTVVLMDPDTLDQMEVSKDLFNNDGLYLRVAESPFFTPLIPPVLSVFPPLSPLPDSFSRAVSVLGLHFQFPNVYQALSRKSLQPLQATPPSKSSWPSSHCVVDLATIVVHGPPYMPGSKHACVSIHHR